MIKILFIGDINGKIGRQTVKKILPELKEKLKPDLIIANAENIAHGIGITESTLDEVKKAGVNWFTNGDHAFSREKSLDIYTNNNIPVLRPANFSQNIPGRGYEVIKTKKGNVLLVNLIGRVFMKMDYDCPFEELKKILSDKNLAEEKLSAIIVDIHAEATSEKNALCHFADGKISALLGTHTHVMTADHKITEQGTAYITDVGMVGLADGCIGIDKENIIKTFLTQIKYPHIIPEKGKAIFNAVLITVNSHTQKAIKIQPIIKYIDIR
jgi:hypothetical protein